MKHFVRFLFGVLLSLWFVSGHAADVVSPGEYMLSGDRGWLKVKQQDGKKLFSLDSIGGNCHSCGLSGRLVGTTAETVDELSSQGMVCRIRMSPSPGGRQVTVEPLTEGACRMYCGMRAGFDGTYRKPQKLCTRAGKGMLATSSSGTTV
jgi:hypothetical protein